MTLVLVAQERSIRTATEKDFRISNSAYSGVEPPVQKIKTNDYG